MIYLNIYSLGLLFLIGINFYLRKSKYKDSKIIYYFIFGFLFIILCLRDPLKIGVDTRDVYLRFYENYSNTPWSEILNKDNFVNIGSFILMKICGGLLGLDYCIWTTIIGLFNTIILIRHIKKYSDNPLGSLLVFFGFLFFTYPISALKQSLAMSFILLAFDGIVENKQIKFYLFVLVASTFHMTSLIFLPAYLILMNKNLKFFVLELVSLFLIVFILRNNILNYMTSVYDTVILNSGGSFLTNKVLLILFFVAYGLVHREIFKDNILFINLIKLISVGAVLQTFCIYNNTFERLADYYFQFSIIYLPLIFNCNNDSFLDNNLINRTEMKIFANLLYIFCFYRSIMYIIDNALYYLPFKVWFL